MQCIAYLSTRQWALSRSRLLSRFPSLDLLPKSLLTGSVGAYTGWFCSRLGTRPESIREVAGHTLGAYWWTQALCFWSSWVFGRAFGGQKSLWLSATVLVILGWQSERSKKSSHLPCLRILSGNQSWHTFGSQIFRPISGTWQPRHVGLRAVTSV